MNLVRIHVAKYILLLLSILFYHWSWAQSAGMFATNYQIKITFSDYKNDTVILANHYGKQQFTVDTALVDATGSATFTGTATDTLRYGVYLIYIPGAKYFDFLINEPEIHLATSAAFPVRDMQVKKSKENQLFFEYLNYLREARESSALLKQQIEEAPADKKAELQKQLVALDTKVKQFIDDFISKHKGTFAAKTVAANKQIDLPEGDETTQYLYYYQHFWDYVDLSDERFIFSPWLTPKVNQYLTRFTMQQPDSINKAADRLVSMTNGNREMYRYMVNYITNLFENYKLMTSEEVFVHMVDNYYQEDKAWWVGPTSLYRIKRRSAMLKPLLIGKTIPNLILKDPAGQVQNLANKTDKYTVLFFYDPTCGTCKKHAPIMEEVRQQYAADGVQFWGIALDVDNSDEGTQKWKDFIEEKGMQAWVNVADLTGEHALLARYDVRKTPTIYVLDEKNEIILKRLGAEQLGEILGKVLTEKSKP